MLTTRVLWTVATIFRASANVRASGFSQRIALPALAAAIRSEEHTSELQSRFELVCRLLLEKKNERRYYVSAGACAWLCPGRGIPRFSGHGRGAAETGRLGAQPLGRFGGGAGFRPHQGGGGF